MEVRGFLKEKKTQKTINFVSIILCLSLRVKCLPCFDSRFLNLLLASFFVVFWLSVNLAKHDTDDVKETTCIILFKIFFFFCLWKSQAFAKSLQMRNWMTTLKHFTWKCWNTLKLSMNKKKNKSKKKKYYLLCKVKKCVSA